MVLGPDNRQVITSFDKFPFSTVAAVDIQFKLPNDSIEPGFGSGIVIAPNHVLTAGHNAYFSSDVSTNALRITTSANQNTLLSREIDTVGDPIANVIGINFLANYDETKASQ